MHYTQINFAHFVDNTFSLLILPLYLLQFVKSLILPFLAESRRGTRQGRRDLVRLAQLAQVPHEPRPASPSAAASGTRASAAAASSDGRDVLAEVEAQRAHGLLSQEVPARDAGQHLHAVADARAQARPPAQVQPQPLRRPPRHLHRSRHPRHSGDHRHSRLSWRSVSQTIASL